MVKNVTGKDSLGCKDHETVQLKILREVRQIAESKVWTSGGKLSAYSGTYLVGSHGMLPWRAKGTRRTS